MSVNTNGIAGRVDFEMNWLQNARVDNPQTKIKDILPKKLIKFLLNFLYLKKEKALQDMVRGFEAESDDIKARELKITCKQTNKTFENPDSAWYFQRIGINSVKKQTAEKENYDYFDKE